ncbi:hypothetical protein [Flavihumibacter fluvii]|uniref:hypothetical protein n=1 Tax=Flavihumibacter fluvii TaxID=2838157 RepID=UPI001BDDEC76|nr:hypothetical protein [Flavihumibacter fluvii]ULQ52839.1 hypothetical protein KJS93_00700 [Flavihumibacter fluvii]
MKFLRLAFLLALPLLTMQFACSKSNDNSGNNPPYTSGTWIVHLFTDSGTDETSDFAGYDFVFATDGKLTATKSGVTTTGTWSARTDDGKQKLELNLVTTDAVLMQVNNDWIILSSSSSLLELGDDNGASGEVLHFMKK